MCIAMIDDTSPFDVFGECSMDEHCSTCLDHIQKDKLVTKPGIYPGRKIKINDTVGDMVLLKETWKNVV